MSEAKIDEFPCIFPASREFRVSSGGPRVRIRPARRHANAGTGRPPSRRSRPCRRGRRAGPRLPDPRSMRCTGTLARKPRLGAGDDLVRHGRRRRSRGCASAAAPASTASHGQGITGLAEFQWGCFGTNRVVAAITAREAYWLLWSMRRLMPKRSIWRVIQFDTLRLRLIKLAARVIELKTQIKIHLPSSAPNQAIFAV